MLARKDKLLRLVQAGTKIQVAWYITMQAGVIFCIFHFFSIFFENAGSLA
jgi:hypothetical protein